MRWHAPVTKNNRVEKLQTFMSTWWWRKRKSTEKNKKRNWELNFEAKNSSVIFLTITVFLFLYNDEFNFPFFYLLKHNSIDLCYVLQLNLNTGIVNMKRVERDKTTCNREHFKWPWSIVLWDDIFYYTHVYNNTSMTLSEWERKKIRTAVKARTFHSFQSTLNLPHLTAYCSCSPSCFVIPHILLWKLLTKLFTHPLSFPFSFILPLNSSQMSWWGCCFKGGMELKWNRTIM